MIRDMRIRIAAALMAGVLLLIGFAQAAPAETPAVRYACDGRQQLLVQRTSAGAVVRFVDRTYALQRKPSDLGEKYLSPTAALIIDGNSAVFAATDRLQLGTCFQTIVTASAR